MKRVALLAGIAVVVAPLVAGAYEGGEVKDGGTITGVVEFEGTPPPPEKIEVTKDQKVCGESKESHALIVNDGKVQNAVVFIEGIEKGKKMEPTTVTFDQKECEYVPHVLVFPPKSKVEILNSDGILHNIHTYSEKNPPMNVAQPKFKKKIEKSFDQPENIEVKCDAHGWMSGVFVVQEHPYYVATDEKGAFELTDVPPGEYTLKVWHEKLGEQTQKVKVEPGGKAEASFKLSAK